MLKIIQATQKNKSLYFAALIGFGFLWTGMAYMIHAYRMLAFLDGKTVNLLVCGVYYVLQAAGIGIVGFLFSKHPSFAGGRLFPLYASIVALISIAISLFSNDISIIIITGGLLNLSIGILSGCCLTRLATNVTQQMRGIVFGGAYAFGSISTWLVSLPMGGRFLWHWESIFALLILAGLSLLLFVKLKPLPPTEGGGYLRAGFRLQDIMLALLVLFLLSLQNILGFAFPLKGAADSVYIEFTRIFYGLGLIIAGLVSDRNRRWGAISCLAALAFPFAALALGSSVTGETTMWMLAYLFLGFWSVYRILVFSDISGKSNLPSIAVFGLMAGRLGEAAGTLGAEIFTGTALVFVAGAVFVLVVILFFLLYQKLYSSNITPEEAEKHRQVEYVNRFKLSAREQEIFSLIIQGYSNMEIASALYITESTVKFHVGNIFKKTGLTNRLDLIADYKLKDR